MPNEITLADAIAMTQLYRQQKVQILKPEYQEMDILPLAEAFNKAGIQALLDDPQCEKIRVYLGMKGNLSICAILVAADKDGNDLLPDEQHPNRVIIEDGQRCPSECAVDSPLMP